LSHCYDQLTERNGALFIFGHGASSNDAHIYDAICRSGLKRVFFCVHNPADHLGSLRERLAPYSERRKDITWSYVDAASAKVWTSEADEK
jgi:hypothetical protein